MAHVDRIEVGPEQVLAAAAEAERLAAAVLDATQAALSATRPATGERGWSSAAALEELADVWARELDRLAESTRQDGAKLRDAAAAYRNVDESTAGSFATRAGED